MSAEDAAEGTAKGALVGSVIPGIGTAAGAVLGGVAGLWGGYKRDKAEAKRLAYEREQAAYERRRQDEEDRRRRLAEMIAKSRGDRKYYAGQAVHTGAPPR